MNLLGSRFYLPTTSYNKSNDTNELEFDFIFSAIKN